MERQAKKEINGTMWNRKEYVKMIADVGERRRVARLSVFYRIHFGEYAN